jgi:RelA/SpoT family (p)ppGpp synthetase
VTTTDPTLAELLAVVRRTYPEDGLGVIERAAALVAERGLSVTPPVDLGQAIDTAGVLAEMHLDPAAVAAALVAAVVVPSKEPPSSFESALGSEVVGLLDGVRRLARMRWDRIEEEAAETLRTMFLAMARDVRVVLVVLAMRVELMRKLNDQALSDAERRRIGRETLDVFAPLANRLGIWQIKWELEDRALEALEPDTYHELVKLLTEGRAERNAFVEEVKTILAERLAEEGVEAQLKGRAKHVFSIYKKMQRKDVGFEQIFDVSALRVIVDKIGDCYAALGVVHATWVPIPAEFDDYIARPKPNGYRSLHTAVIGPRGRPFEVQIRTREMHQFAEFGVAAHWAYKEQKSAAGQDKFTVLRQLMDWEREIVDPHQFVDSLKTDLFEDQVYVFTPNGDVIELPAGATPLDFAYRIHTMVGHRCRGAKINGDIQSLDTPLHTGDRVEILTQKHPHPSRDWMNPSFGFLKTSSARQKVRQWFRQQDRDTAIQQGRELVDKELQRLDVAAIRLEDIAEALKYRSVEDLFAAVGYGDRSSQSVASAALQIERARKPPSEPPLPPSVPQPKRRGARGLRLDDIDDIEARRGRCCNPVPGDDVVGFVTRGRGIVIHRRTCANVRETEEPERLVEIDWGSAAAERYPVDVVIEASDRPGLLRDLSNLVALDGVNMTSARAQSARDGSATLRLGLEFASADQVVKTLQRLANHRDVFSVQRIAR